MNTCVSAVTGKNALVYVQELESTAAKAAGALRVTVPELSERIQTVLDHSKALEKEISALKGQLASHQGDALLSKAVDVKGYKLLVA